MTHDIRDANTLQVDYFDCDNIASIAEPSRSLNAEFCFSIHWVHEFSEPSACMHTMGEWMDELLNRFVYALAETIHTEFSLSQTQCSLYFPFGVGSSNII